jgi:hypothetical protein
MSAFGQKRTFNTLIAALPGDFVAADTAVTNGICFPFLQRGCLALFRYAHLTALRLRDAKRDGHNDDGKNGVKPFVRLVDANGAQYQVVFGHESERRQRDASDRQRLQCSTGSDIGQQGADNEDGAYNNVQQVMRYVYLKQAVVRNKRVRKKSKNADGNKGQSER